MPTCCLASSPRRSSSTAPRCGRWVNDLTAATIASAKGNHCEDEPIPGSTHRSNVRTTALVLRALTAVAPEHPLIEETVRWLVTARTANGWDTMVARA